MDIGDSSEEIRSAEEVAKRTLALFSIVGVALGADRREVVQWLLDNELWSALAPSEVGFLDSPSPSLKQVVDATWLSERLVVLAWALGHVSELPDGDEQCDPSIFQESLPPFSGSDVREFIAGSAVRPKAELIVIADEILNLHWEARDAKINSRKPRMPVNLEIIQERHHAINWIIGYDGLPWDEVTTDT
jgi:hypothetical protein